ncbi:hypothetical protein PEXP_020400 [Penicillium expansum]|nr:hypothetical protein PEXP_020400 [Penicillium expansum]
MAQRLEEGQQDPLHIFSEFDDIERQQLIAKMIHDDPIFSYVPRQNLYALWFSDINVLRDMANARTEEQKYMRETDLWRFSIYDIAGVASEGQSTEASLRKRTRSRSPTVPSPESTSTVRERDPWSPWDECGTKEEKKEIVGVSLSESGIRDGYQCVVTKRGLPLIESAYILPKKLNGVQAQYLKRSNCWFWLRGFWDQEKVDKLHSLLISEGTMDMERLYNQITLETQVQTYWYRAMCALRPIWVSEDRTEMQIAFHWLPLKENLPGAAEHVRSDFVPIMENPYQDPKYRPRESPGRNNIIFHTETVAIIPSGYVFMVKTDNKKERSPPSMELLELRWHLSRIACMQGRSEHEDGDYESDGDSVFV